MRTPRRTDKDGGHARGDARFDGEEAGANPDRLEVAQGVATHRVIADLPEHVDARPQLRGDHRLVGPLATEALHEQVAQQRLAGLRELGRVGAEVHVRAPHDEDLGRVRGGCASRANRGRVGWD